MAGFVPGPAKKAVSPVPAKATKVGRNPAAARRDPHIAVPAIWPTLGAALSRPNWMPRAPGSSLAIARVAGQNAARDTTRASWPSISIQNPWANMSQTPATTLARHEPSRMRRPPMRSV